MNASFLLYIGLAVLGLVLFLWGLRRLFRPNQKPRLYEVVHDRVYETVRNDPEASIPYPEVVCFHAYNLHLYLMKDGVDTGVGNMEPAKVREALPALEPLGLTAAAEEIAAFVDVYEEIERLKDVDEGLGEEYQETARDLDRRLYPVLREIPDRLDAYLAKAM